MDDPTISKSSITRSNAIRKFLITVVFVVIVVHLVGYCTLLSRYNDQNVESNEKVERIEKEVAALKTDLLLVTNVESNTQAQAQPKAIMIIAVYPTSADRILAIWSQLECFSDAYEKIVIVYSAGGVDDISNGFVEMFRNLINEVSRKMPEIFSKIEIRVFYENVRRDTGLWCNYLTVDNILQKGSKGTYVGGAAYYDSFLLINDSVMALQHSNELLDTLHTKNQSLVSLNFWGGNYSTNPNNRSSFDPSFWVESVARVFNLEGIQIFADKICSQKDEISWRKHCPEIGKSHPYWPNKTKNKKCIVELMEVGIASMYSPNKVLGLYPGEVPELMINFPSRSESVPPRPPFTISNSWTSHYIFWKSILRDKMKFPALKITNKPLLTYVINRHPEVMHTCFKRKNKAKRNKAKRNKVIRNKDCGYNLSCRLKVMFLM